MAGPAIDLPSLVTSLSIDMSGLVGAQADAARQGTVLGERLGEAMRERIRAALGHLPEIEITADTSQADRDLADLRAKLAALADRRIGIDISAEKAARELQDLQVHLERLSLTHPDVEVTANIGRAMADLAAVTAAAETVDQISPDIDVDVDVHDGPAEVERLARDFTGLAANARGAVSALGSVAATAGLVAGVVGALGPVVAGAAQALASLAPAAAVAATATTALASAGAAAKIGLGGVGDTLKAAFAPATGGGAAAATTATNAYADAQRNLAATIQTTADNNTRALRQVGDAERNLADAQKAALVAQQDLNDARREAAQDLEDQNNRLADAMLSQRDATLRVQDAQLALQSTINNDQASARQRAQAQLTYDQAVQRLREQDTQVQRLRASTADANAAGVEGSQKVTAAQDKLALAQRRTGDEARNLADAQQQVKRTAQQGEEAIRRATEALQQAGVKAGGAAGGVDKLAEAMAKLAPSAREFVQEVIALQPAWDVLRLDVQQELFNGLAASMRENAGTVLPVLQQGLVGAAGALNSMAVGVVETAGHLSSSGVLGQALASAATGLRNLEGVPGAVLTAIATLSAGAGPLFDRLTAGAGNAVDKINQRLAAGLESGGLSQAIEGAAQQFGVLVDVVGNVGRLLGEVFGPAQQQGASFLDTLKAVTGSMAAAFGTPAVQDGLRSLFQTVAQLASSAMPLLNTALQAIGPVLTALGPPVQELLKALGGDGLQPILDALAPVILVAAKAVGSLVVAASPLLGLIGTLVAALLPALTPLLDGANTIFRQLQPVVAALAGALADLLVPILGVLPDLIQPFVDILTALTGAVLPILTQLLTELPLGQVGQSVADLAAAFAPLLAHVATLVTALLTHLTPLLPPLITLATSLATILTGVLAESITNIVVPAVRMIAQLLDGDFSGAARSCKELLIGISRTIVDVFTEVPGAILAAFGELIKSLYHVGADLIASLIRGVTSKLGDLASTFDDVTDWIKQHKGPPERDARLLTPAGQLIMDGLIAGVDSRRAALGAQLQSVTRQISDGLSGAMGGPSLAMAGSPSALSGSYAGLGRPVYQNNVINLYGDQATAAGVSEELSWRAKVGIR